MSNIVHPERLWVQSRERKVKRWMGTAIELPGQWGIGTGHGHWRRGRDIARFGIYRQEDAGEEDASTAGDQLEV